MATRRLGIIMNGVTGRMGTNQHLVRSIVAIRKEGGVKLPNGDRVMPDPILLGRNADKLEAEGYAKAAAPDQADVVVFNTCCIREKADTRLYGTHGLEGGHGSSADTGAGAWPAWRSPCSSSCSPRASRPTGISTWPPRPPDSRGKRARG